VNGPYLFSKVSRTVGGVTKGTATTSVFSVGVVVCANASCWSFKTPVNTYPVTQKFNANKMTQIRAYVVLTWVNELVCSHFVCFVFAFMIILSL